MEKGILKLIERRFESKKRRWIMSKEKLTGRVTIPTDVDVVQETLELVKLWGADAIRDCDGTDYPAELRDVDAKV